MTLNPFIDPLHYFATGGILYILFMLMNRLVFHSITRDSFDDSHGEFEPGNLFGFCLLSIVLTAAWPASVILILGIITRRYLRRISIFLFRLIFPR